MTAGYLAPSYARSFAPAVVCHLPQSGGWLLHRPIAGTSAFDVIGLYPYLCCRRWDALADDLESLRGGPVSIVAATDPFGDNDPLRLSQAFDFARPFKEHFVIDTALPLEAHVKRSHRDIARRALRRVDVTVAEQPADWAGDWIRLYDILCARHDITGTRRFAEATLTRQLDVPGAVLFRAALGDQTIGLDLWYVQDGVAHGHLAAFDAEGYRLRASYATKLFMIEYFRHSVAWINLGGTPGGNEGLADFKRGFASGTRSSWLCGRIFDRAACDRITAARGIAPDTAYFPPYRTGETF